jgi:outer membrane protein assembly factor BamB
LCTRKVWVGSNWQSPSYDPANSWLYVVARDDGQGYRTAPVAYEPGRQYIGGEPFPAGDSAGEGGKSSVLAIDTTTGDVKWKFPIVRGSFGTFWRHGRRNSDCHGFQVGQVALVFPDRRYDRIVSDELIQ